MGARPLASTGMIRSGRLCEGSDPRHPRHGLARASVLQRIEGLLDGKWVAMAATGCRSCCCWR